MTMTITMDKSFFLIWIIWCFYAYGTSFFLVSYLMRLLTDYDEDDLEDDLENESISEEMIKQVKKYEDKYLDDIRQLNKEWVFTDEESEQIPTLASDFFNASILCKQERIEEIEIEIDDLHKAIFNDKSSTYIDEDGDNVEGDDIVEDNQEKEEKIKLLEEELAHVKLVLDSDEERNKLMIESEQHAKQYIINKRIEKLHNCFVMEKTPIGNVLMIYDKSKETFKYYSDCTIPYRYLEVVGRKYVKLFSCRPIFVDMDDELRLFEEKWEKQQELKKLKEEEEKKEDLLTAQSNSSNTDSKKKNVFAKFKSYNKDAGGKISMAAPPKNNIPNKQISDIKENEKILLKERANRYTYEGKFANFNFLQKIERKVFNKRLGLSFADFKKMRVVK